ncbi:MAG: type IV secretory system conjugative DNA transfer family protein [Bdellovibrionota bacterium]
MSAIFSSIHAASAFRMKLHPEALPGAGLFQSMVGNGFVILAVLVVAYLGYRNNSGAARIKRNKSKHNRPSRSDSNELGSGDLATRAQIQRWLEHKDKFDTVLPVRMIKGGDGIAAKQGNLIIPIEERNRHILVVAKTGSGKTTRAILPVLFNDCLCPDSSTVVLDSKPEMWDKLVGLTRKFNPKKRILLFNPLDLERSLSWNILAKINSDTDAKLIANTIISATDNPSSKSDSPFFRNNALSLLNSIMVGLLNDEKEVLSMPRVHQLINSGMEPLCKWLEQHPQAIRNSKTFVDLARSGSQNADTIMSELGMRLAAWDLTTIRATTALNELDLELLIAEPTLLIIELRESELEMLRPMANVIVVELLRYLTKRAESCPRQTLPRPVGIVIDEFASALGRLPDIHVKLNTLRSRNVSIVAAIQSIAQIKANYDRDADSVLAGFSSKILMPNLDFQDAEWASKETGTMTVRFNVASIGKNKRMIDYFATKNDNLQEQVQQRPVLTPDEIGRPVDNAATFFLPNTPVFQGHLVPYYEVPEIVAKFESAKGLDYKLREAPIEFEEVLPEPTITETPAQLSPQEILQKLQEARVSLKYELADPTAQEWWVALEKLNEKTPNAVLSLTEQLTKRGVSLADFYQIYVNSGIDNIDELIRVIDANLLSSLRMTLGWDTANQHARDWWLSFEEANKDNALTIIELGQELIRRNVTIEDFFGAYVHSDCNSVPELLNVLDQMLERAKAAAAAAQPEVPAITDNHSAQALPALESFIPAPLEPNGDHELGLGALSSQIVYESDSGTERPLADSATIIRPSAVSNSGVGDLSPVMEQTARAPIQSQAVANEPVAVSSAVYVSPREQKQKATQSVHVSSYMEMGEELLSQGKMSDFDKLVELARDDSRFPKECMLHFDELRSQFSK